MSEIPTDIKDIEAARTWLLRHGYSADMAEVELANWESPEDGDDDNEIEDIEEEELTWDDEEDDEEDEDWDDDEEEDESWDEEDDDDEDDK